MAIKVCGMKNPENIREVASLRPDFMGFIFHDPSPRCCRGLDPAIVRSLSTSVTPVMVTVNMAEEETENLAALFGITTLQLHGSESPDLCRYYRDSGFRVWKAMSLSGEEDLMRLERYADAVDLFLFDTPTVSYGGSGMKFDWNILDHYDLPVRFLLSGGISPDDVWNLKEFHHDRCAGFDVNSRFELIPGEKDCTRLRSFIRELRGYSQK